MRGETSRSRTRSGVASRSRGALARAGARHHRAGPPGERRAGAGSRSHRCRGGRARPARLPGAAPDGRDPVRALTCRARSGPGLPAIGAPLRVRGLRAGLRTRVHGSSARRSRANASRGCARWPWRAAHRPRDLPAAEGLEVRGYVHELWRNLAICDVAVVQGGLTTAMELLATGRPFVSPPASHFEQRCHLRHRLDRHGATELARVRRGHARAAGRRHRRGHRDRAGLPAGPHGRGCAGRGADRRAGGR